MKEQYNLYNGKITLEFDPSKHLYTVNKRIVPSVTQIVSKAIDKSGALMGWAVNQAIDKIEEKVLAGKTYDEIQLKEILEEARFAHKQFKNKAGDIGTLTHEWIELYIAGRAPTMPINPAIASAVNAFLSWEKSHTIKWIKSEQKIYSKKYRYAGTCDFLAEIDGNLEVGDFKTSGGIYHDAYFQTAAYQQALMEELDVPIKQRRIIRIAKNHEEVEEKVLYDFKEDLKTFIAALIITKRLNKLKEEDYVSYKNNSKG